MENIIEIEKELHSHLGKTVDVSDQALEELEVEICKIAIKIGDSTISPALASMFSVNDLYDLLKENESELKYVNVPKKYEGNEENLFLDHVLFARMNKRDSL